MLQLLSPRPGVERTRSLPTTTRERPCSNKTQGSPQKGDLHQFSPSYPPSDLCVSISSGFPPVMLPPFMQISTNPPHSIQGDLLTILLPLNFSISAGTFASSTSMLYLFSLKKTKTTLLTAYSLFHWLFIFLLLLIQKLFKELPYLPFEHSLNFS